MIHGFLFELPDCNIRVRDLDDVLELIRTRTVHLVERTAPDQLDPLVGTCYIDGPPNAGAEEFELGGAFIMERYRKHGLFRVLALSALVHHLVADAPLQQGLRLIGHVVTSNSKPRRVMESLGFELAEAGRRYHPDSVAGISHMPRDADGFVVADTFVFPPERYESAVLELMRFDGHVIGSDNMRWRVEIRIPPISQSELPGILAHLREELANLEP